MLGLSVATVAGVPASTWLGQSLGWRSAYWAVLGVTVLTALLILAFVPSSPGDRSASVRGELSALKKPQVLFAAAAGMVGFGGVFAMYSYVAPDRHRRHRPVPRQRSPASCSPSASAR